MARILSWIAVVTSLSVLAAAAIGFVAFRVIVGKIDRECVFGAECQPAGKPVARPPAAPGKALNFLLVGSDSREGATPDELREFGTEFEGGKRTDTIILVHLSAKRDKVVFVSFPRDSYVEIPGHGKSRINAAYGKDPEHGAALLVQTVEHLTNVRIDHYMEVDFAGFLKMVNALGGVDVCLSQPAKDHYSGIDLPAGRQRIKGTQALAFVRQRHELPRADLDRIDRQKHFISAMLDRATSIGMLANPPRLYRFLDAAAQSLTVDKDLSIGTMKRLADRVRTLDPAKVTFVTAPVSDANYRLNGMSLVRLDEVAGRALYDAIRNDDALPGATPAPAKQPTDLTILPSRIRLRVLNGNGVPGQARSAAGELAGLGFQIRGTADADATTYQQTVVRYGPSRADSVRTVAAAIPGSAIQLDQSLGGVIEVVVGSSYAGVRPVTISAQQPPAKAPAIPTSTAADQPAGCVR